VLLFGGTAAFVALSLRTPARIPARLLLVPVLVQLVYAALAGLRPLYTNAELTAVDTAPLLAVAIAVTYASKRSLSPLLEHVRFALLLGFATWVGVEVIRASALPRVDVFTLQTAGVDDLLNGYNPYETVAVVDTHAAGLVVPYTYPPLQLLLTLPARVLGGDVRYTMLAGLIIAAVATRQAVRRHAPESSPVAQDLFALLMCAGPLNALLLEHAWTEPAVLGVLALALWAYSAQKLGLAAVLFGLAFSAKQMLVFGFVLLPLLPRVTWRHVALAAAAALAVIAPFFVLDARALWYSVVSYHLSLPPRFDSLTLTNLIDNRFDVRPSGLLPLFATTAIIAGFWRYIARDITSMMLLLGAALFVFFATGKQAFMNYYFLVAGLLAISASFSSRSSEVA
jgi:hypothetical protein